MVYPVGRCRFQLLRLAGIWVASGVGLVAWLAQLGHLLGWPGGLALAAWGVLGWGAWATWNGTVQGQLRWDGQLWWFLPDGVLETQPCSLHVHHHGGRVLGLRLTWRPQSSMSPGGRVGALVWVWAHEEADPGRWLALRRAVYSPPVPVLATAGQQDRPNEAQATGSALQP